MTLHVKRNKKIPITSAILLFPFRRPRLFIADNNYNT